MLKPLAEILIEEQLASREVIERAAQLCDEKGAPLVEVLVRELGVDELAMVAAIRRQVRVPLVDPATAEGDPEALRVLPRDMCRRLRVMPLAIAEYGRGERLLRLGMADPTDAVALAEVEHQSGCRAAPELMVLSAVEEMVEKSYGAFVTKVMPRPATETQPATVPFHRVSDEADVTLRFEALTGVLIAKGLLSEEELDEAVRQLLKERTPEG